MYLSRANGSLDGFGEADVVVAVGVGVPPEKPLAVSDVERALVVCVCPVVLINGPVNAGAATVGCGALVGAGTFVAMAGAGGTSPAAGCVPVVASGAVVGCAVVAVGAASAGVAGALLRDMNTNTMPARNNTLVTTIAMANACDLLAACGACTIVSDMAVPVCPPGPEGEEALSAGAAGNEVGALFGGTEPLSEGADARAEMAGFEPVFINAVPDCAMTCMVSLSAGFERAMSCVEAGAGSAVRKDAD